MLARLALLLVMLPTLAIAASADVLPDGGKLVIPPPVKPDPVANATPAATATPPPTFAYAPPISPAADPSECRMSCAQSLYFCSAGDRADNCSSTWTRCVATCNSPELNPTASATP
jgi:hypothetical protein